MRAPRKRQPTDPAAGKAGGRTEVDTDHRREAGGIGQAQQIGKIVVAGHDGVVELRQQPLLDAPLGEGVEGAAGEEVPSVDGHRAVRLRRPDGGERGAAFGDGGVEAAGGDHVEHGWVLSMATTRRTVGTGG